MIILFYYFKIDAFLEGFHELVPPELVSIFDAQELELLISGLPDIDLDDLRAHTEYHGYKVTDPVISYFWSVLRGFSQEEKALFLQFVTGTSKVRLILFFFFFSFNHYPNYFNSSSYYYYQYLFRFLWMDFKHLEEVEEFNFFQFINLLELIFFHVLILVLIN